MTYVKPQYVDELARQLKDLAPPGCSTTHDAEKRGSVLAPLTGYAAAKVYSSPDLTWFYLNTELVSELADAGFAPEKHLEKSALLRDKGKYKLAKLRIEAVCGNEDLFRKVMEYTVDVRDERSNRTKRPN